MKKTAFILAVLLVVGIVMAQNKVNIVKVDATPTGPQTAANSDSVTCATNTCVPDGSFITFGAKADAKSTATDTTAITAMQVLKEISAMVQAPPSQAVTNAGTFATQSQPTPVTSGGLTNYTVEAGSSDNHVNIKNGAGQVYYIHAYTKHTAAQYLRLYNAATGFNGCGSATNLVWEGIIPAASTGSGLNVDISNGIAFGTGISICVTGAFGNTDTTSATASVTTVDIGYK